MAGETPQKSMKLSEDWLATIIGLVIVAIIGAGFIGPGPQNAQLRAAVGERDSTEARAVDGWSISARIGDESVVIVGAPTVLADGQIYNFICHDGQIRAEPVNAGVVVSGGYAMLQLINQCDVEATVNYKIANAIPWPLFGFFD